MACDLLVGIFVCGMPSLFRLILGLFIPVGGLVMNIIGMVASSILIYVLVKSIGKIGGIIMIVVGLVGAVFTLGTTLALSAIGFAAVFLEKFAIPIVIANIALYVLCMFMGCI